MLLKPYLSLIVRSKGESEGHVERIVAGGVGADISDRIVGMNLT